MDRTRPRCNAGPQGSALHCLSRFDVRRSEQGKSPALRRLQAVGRTKSVSDNTWIALDHGATLDRRALPCIVFRGSTPVVRSRAGALRSSGAPTSRFAVEKKAPAADAVGSPAAGRQGAIESRIARGHLRALRPRRQGNGVEVSEGAGARALPSEVAVRTPRRKLREANPAPVGSAAIP